jgi:hypothetical protein
LSCVTISNPNLLSRSEKTVYPGMRSWKKALVWLGSMSVSHWWYRFPREVKRWDSTAWFRIWQFQTPAWKRYFKMQFLAEWFIFWERWSRFSDRGSQDVSTSQHRL